MSELKPCPFCGNKLNSEYTISYDYIRKCYVLYHECTFLRCHIAIYGATQEECIAAWNRRAERTGRWEQVETVRGLTYATCSECGYRCGRDTVNGHVSENYCKDCGAHMIETGIPVTEIGG